MRYELEVVRERGSKRTVGQLERQAQRYGRVNWRWALGLPSCLDCLSFVDFDFLTEIEAHIPPKCERAREHHLDFEA